MDRIYPECSGSDPFHLLVSSLVRLRQEPHDDDDDDEDEEEDERDTDEDDSDDEDDEGDGYSE
ncbi:MAG: hypothetical protein WA609_03525 [Terriglobales bacterium]